MGLTEGQFIQVRGGAAPEGPGDERTPPFERLLRKIWRDNPECISINTQSSVFNSFEGEIISPADSFSVSVGRGFRMNWHCLYTCSCSTCMALCRSAGGAAASFPPWDVVCLTWFIWMLKGNSWPETQERRQSHSLKACYSRCSINITITSHC